MVRLVPILLLLAGLVGCSEDEPTSSPPETSSATPVDGCPEVRRAGEVDFDQSLHDELMAMFERDQAGRTGGGDPEGDEARTQRLREILAEHGWPGFDLVGDDGEDAAWTIAQHADLDPEFQRCTLTHLRQAVDEGQGSPGNLAYLTDRVAVSAGEPQTYGTQLRCARGRPRPVTPLVDEQHIDRLRREAGLPPWKAYLKEFAAICEAPQ